MNGTLTVLLIIAAAAPALPVSDMTPEMLEETGLSGCFPTTEPFAAGSSGDRGLTLLIPDSNADVIAMFNPEDGTYEGIFIEDDTTGTQYDFATPINAVQGPDGYVYVSDQLSDAVYVFDGYGEFLWVGAETDLNNLRGIDFRNDTLFVTSGDDYVAMFSGPDEFAGYFIQDGSDPFDIHFLDDGTCLLANIQGTSDDIRHYEADGQSYTSLFSVNFPEQVQADAENPDHYLNVAFSADQITEFLLDGTIVDTWSLDGGRGVYRLGNGNLLATNGDGVHEIDPATGSIIETEYEGSGRFIELADLPVVDVAEHSGRTAPAPALSVRPNPFRDLLFLELGIRSAGRVEAEVYSLDGRLVRTLASGNMEAGDHMLTWDGRSEAGTSLGSGTYLVRVRAGEAVSVSKVNLLR
ncbi:MAG: FlgD immunoglobulin-like domain containing protein [Candidatus Fermentibacteraceae bacterium]